MRRLCVYCGASAGRDPAHASTARALGAALARREITLVYGGGRVGLMGTLADAVLAAGGRVVGVIPRFLARAELAHPGLTESCVTESMHERKAVLAARADGFLALPGGFGTLEELLETLTWAQLGLHGRPVGLLDATGYFEEFLRFLDRMVAEGFLAPAHRRLLHVGADPEELLDRLARTAARPPEGPGLDRI